MTPKQALQAHLRVHHRGVTGVDRMSFDRLRRVHAHQHFHYATNHVHQAKGETNTGPDARPRGWYTGEDVVLRKQGYLNRSGFGAMFESLEAEQRKDR